MDFRNPEDAWRSTLSTLLRRCGHGRKDWRTKCEIHPSLWRKSGVTTDRRSIAGFVEKILGRQGFREDNARIASGQRSLQGRELGCWSLYRLSPLRRLLGQGPSSRAGP